MSADEIEALAVRLERYEQAQKRIAELVRRTLIGIIHILEKEFNLPPIK